MNNYPVDYSLESLKNPCPFFKGWVNRCPGKSVFLPFGLFFFLFFLFAQRKKPFLNISYEYILEHCIFSIILCRIHFKFISTKIMLSFFQFNLTFSATWKLTTWFKTHLHCCLIRQDGSWVMNELVANKLALLTTEKDRLTCEYRAVITLIQTINNTY